MPNAFVFLKHQLGIEYTYPYASSHALQMPNPVAEASPSPDPTKKQVLLALISSCYLGPMTYHVSKG